MNTSARLTLIALIVASLPLCAASEYPPSYRWRTIETPHFFINYHQGEEDLARRAAAIAEQVHARITPLMDYEPAGRTHIVLTDHIDLSNGSATPFPFNRIEIYVSAPGGDPSSPIEYYDNWLNLVITHEYTHILHLDQARGFAGGLRKVLGRHPLTFPNDFSPLWMTEGIATLVESEATDAGRLKGTFVDMVLRTSAIENRWLSQAQAGGLSPEWPGGSARYFYGSKFLGWVARTRGMDRLAEYFHDYAGNVIPYRVNASAEDVFGHSMNDLWRTWSDEQQREYRDGNARLAADGLTTRTVLTQLGYETKYPAISADGTRIAYVHDGPFEWPTIRVRDLAAQRDIAVERVTSTSPLSWSPDGATLAFAQLDFHRSFALVSDLYLWRVDGRVERLTTGARLKDPSFAPDGRSLIAVENRAGRNRLVELDLATRAMRTLVEPADLTQFSEPSVSHDGSRIAVAEWRDGRVDVVLYDRSGNRIAHLTESQPRATFASPRFTADDATILFSSDVTGVPNIYAMRVAPHPASGHPLPEGEGVAGIRRLTNVYGGAFFPSSRDGKRIYYIDYSSRGFDLASFDATRDYPIVPRIVPKTLVTRAAEVRANCGADNGRAGRAISSIAQHPAALVDAHPRHHHLNRIERHAHRSRRRDIRRRRPRVPYILSAGARAHRRRRTDAGRLRRHLFVRSLVSDVHARRLRLLG
jgi:Tol biopolymer transport system component